jgi:uncharacterized protein (TIGR02145 family)
MKHILTFAALAFATACFGQVPDYVPTDGLVAWYPFNGNVQDESGNGLHASEFAVAFGENRANAPASCIELPSSNSKVVTPILGVSGGQSRTVAFWVSKVSLNEHWGFTNAVGSHQSGDPGSAFGCGFNFGTLQGVSVDVENGAVTYQSNLDSIYAGWVHYAFAVPDLSEVLVEDVLVYENGEMLENVLNSVSPESLLNTLSWEYIIGGAEGFSGSLGLFEDQNVDFGNPKIDDVGFWSRALSSDEIHALYLSEWELFGCTDPLSCNYSEAAQEDDGSCLPDGSPTGCTDSTACNYGSEALCEDGSCIYPPFNLTDCHEGAATCGVGTVWDASTQSCIVESPSDSDFDGCVSMTDLLDLLSVFGTCNETPWSCGDPLEYQGYDYETVQIGDQCWFAENLRGQVLSNGDSLIENPSDSIWTTLNAPAWSYFGSNPETLENGLLYNGHAALDERGICPSGWFTPSDDDWKELESHLGMTFLEVDDDGWRGTDEGGQLKSSAQDSPAWDGLNEVGFGALPAGYRASFNGTYYDTDVRGYFWTSSAYASLSWFRMLESDHDQIRRTWSGREAGMSIRCIHDSE